MLILCLFCLAARADVPPPAGSKRVPYFVEVDSPPTSGAHRLVVYPSSTSRGAPEAVAAVVPASGRVELGGRVLGQPAFWLVPEDQAAALENMDEEGLKTWFEGSSAIRCQSPPIRPQTQTSVLGGSEIVDRFALSAEEASCTLTQVGERTGTGPALPSTESGAGCGCTTASAAALPASTVLFGLFGLLALVRSRRD